ncbi:hypothetical protein Brsp07_04604 [Brucella sp. NBRC 14130]|jgi:hypothetical protein|uniref:hypothetical protein n=1 Tax=Brucella sp. NBRC 14130 TaxID=3075483 RepID=UPI0030AB544D
MENAKLEDGASAFYTFLSDMANIMPIAFGFISLAVCCYTGYNIWYMVQNEHSRSGNGTLYGNVVGFGFGALLGITTVVTYALSRMWS